MNPYSLDSYLPSTILSPKIEGAFGTMLTGKDFFSWNEISQFGLQDSFMKRMSYLLLTDFPDQQIASLIRQTGTIQPEGILSFITGIKNVYFDTLALTPSQVTSLLTRQVQVDLVFKLAPQVVTDQLLFSYGPSVEYTRFIELISFLPDDYDLKEILQNYAEAKPQSEYMKTKINRNILIILQNLRKDEPAEFFADQLRSIADEIGIFEIESDALKAYAQMIPDPFVEKRIEHYLLLENLTVIDIERASSLLLGELESVVKTTTLNLDFSIPESGEPESDAFGELKPKFTTSPGDKPFSPFFDLVSKSETPEPGVERSIHDAESGFEDTHQKYFQSEPVLSEVTPSDSQFEINPNLKDTNPDIISSSDTVESLQPQVEDEPLISPVVEVEPEPEISLFDRIIQETRQDIALAVMEQLAKPEPVAEPEPSKQDLQNEVISLFDAIMPDEPKRFTEEIRRPEPISLDSPVVPSENTSFFEQPQSQPVEPAIEDEQPSNPFYTPLEQLMSESQARGFIKHIFRKNESRFYSALTDLNQLQNWEESKGYIEQIYKEFNVDLYSNEAIEFTDLVYSRYNL